MMQVRQSLSQLFNSRAFKLALLLFISIRLFLFLWAFLALSAVPFPLDDPAFVDHFFLGEGPLVSGQAGLWLGPWQRYDTLHYLRIALEGYNVEDSVFPPLYPLLIRGSVSILALLSGQGRDWGVGSTSFGYQVGLMSAIIIANLAYIGCLVLFYRVTAKEVDQGTAVRAIIYLSIFPTSFFFFAPYTESLFFLFALASLWSARQGNFWSAGLLGFLASLTRLTGWVLIVPLAYEYLRQREIAFQQPTPLTNWRWSNIDWTVLAAALPPLGTLLFWLWRWVVGLPSLPVVYEQYWLQTTAFPGLDIVTALGQIVGGEAPFRLYIDLFALLLIGVTTAVAWRRLPTSYTLYSLMMLLFILLPHSDQKPLFSFSRYLLVFFPTFIILGQAGRNRWLNRLILYPSFAFYLFLSGQFFIGGWVA